MAAPTRQHEQTLRVFIEREPDGRFCAEGVDYFLLGFGDSPDAALEALTDQYRAYLRVAEQRGIEPLFNLRRHEPQLIAAWEQAERDGRIETRPLLARGTSHLPISKLLIMPVAEAA